MLRSSTARPIAAPQGGCLSKLDGLSLRQLLESAHRRVFGTLPANGLAPEDSAILPVSGDALLVSVDFGRPVGVAPLIAGKIAALHAMSDVLACGGVPRWALAMLGAFEPRRADETEELLVGLLDACRAENVTIVGGHTIVGAEPLVGLTVLGDAPARPPLPKCGGLVGDRLLLSKPLGVGLLLRAHGLGAIPADALLPAVAAMLLSNREASKVAASSRGVRATTDVSGFGLLGHLSEMLPTGRGARIHLAAVPVLPGIDRLGEGLTRSEQMRANLEYAREHLRIAGDLGRPGLAPLLDPQTNGGLLVAVDVSSADQLVAAGYVDIGEITGEPSIVIA